MYERTKRCSTLLLILTLAFIDSCGRDDPPVFDGGRAYGYLLEQCEIGPRYPGSVEHGKLRRYLVGKLEEFNASVSLQSFDAVLTTGDTLHLINIIGNYNRSSGRRMLLGAHYDTRPRADRDPNPANRVKPIIGANDGASGVAVLLEIARVLGTSEPPIGVDIVLFDGEDYGEEGVPQDYILGSMYFANHLKGYNPFSVIIVDMVGELDVEIRREGYSSAASPNLVSEVFELADKLGVSEFRKERGMNIIDDHIPFIQAGIPAIVLIDFDYPFWHTVGDTPDKCSPESLSAVGRVLIEYIWTRR